MAKSPADRQRDYRRVRSLRVRRLEGRAAGRGPLSWSGTCITHASASRGWQDLAAQLTAALSCAVCYGMARRGPLSQCGSAGVKDGRAVGAHIWPAAMTSSSGAAWDAAGTSGA
jgi:hypothetical protein